MEINQLDRQLSIVDCRLSNFEMKSFQNIAKPSEAKKNINDNFYFLWNSFLQRLSKMITKSLPQQSFFYIISIEKRRKRFGMKMKMKMKMNEKWTRLLIFDIVRFSNEVVTKRECLLMQVKKTQTWIHGKYIQYYSISISIEIFASRVPWRWRYCKSKQCSNDNFPTFAKPSEVKENTNQQFHSLLLYCTSLYCSFCRSKSS